MLTTSSVKNWFRAYLNLGLIEKILGHTRLHNCIAGKGFAFIDPWSDVWACNVRTDLPMGNLEKQSWDDIVNSDEANISYKKVKECEQNCWMVTTARTAMRSKVSPSLPKIGPALWVLTNKLRVMLGKEIPFNKYINYSNVLPNVITSVEKTQKPAEQIKRISWLNEKPEKKIQKKTDVHYKHGEYYNL